MPERIQLRRTKGWRKPEGAIVVARPGKWGNPYKIKPYRGGWTVSGPTAYCWGRDWDEARARRKAVELFRHEWLTPDLIGDLYVIRDLRGRDLACWCPLDQPCHADVLLEVANA